MTETLLLTTLFATQWIIVSQIHRKGVRTLLFFKKKCKLLCCYDFFLPSPCKFEKDGLRLDLEQELFESADDDNDVMSKPYE